MAIDVRSGLEKRIRLIQELRETTESLSVAMISDPEFRRFAKIDWNRAERYAGLNEGRYGRRRIPEPASVPKKIR